MIAFWTAPAAAFAAPQPPKLIDGTNIITADDYPTAALRAGSYGRVSMHLQVMKAGQVASNTGVSSVSMTLKRELSAPVSRPAQSKRLGMLFVPD